MGTGYTRNDTGNNIADGNVINASDLDGEFDAVEAAFNASTGHTHDGTSAEGAPIEVAGPAQDLVITATEVRPKTDNTLDLGTGSFEFKDLYLDGTANIDSLVADTADINAGSIDGVTLGTNSAVTSAVITTADINGGTIDGATLGTNSAITEAQVDNININGNAITSTDTNGNIALTPDGTGEVDISKVDIDSGTIDSTVIGGTTTAAGSFTTLQADTSLNVDGTVTADGLTVDGGTDGTPLLLLQSNNDSGTKRNTLQFKNTDGIILDGDTVGSIEFFSSDVTNPGVGAFIDAEATGSSPAINLLFGTRGGATLAEHMRITSSGNVGIGTTSPDQTLHVHRGSAGSIASQADSVLTLENSSNAILQFLTPAASNAQIRFGDPSDNGAGYINYGHSSNVLSFGVNGPEKMRIDSSGNVGIGTTSPAYKLHVSDTGAVSSRTYATDATGDASFFVGNNDGRLAGPLVYGSTKSAYGALGSNETAFYSNTSTTLMADGGSAIIKFATGGNTERLRIDSSGNVHITDNTNGPDAALHIEKTTPRIRLQLNGNSGYNTIESGGTNELIFGRTGSEQMRIDDSGNVGIGATSISSEAKLAVNGQIKLAPNLDGTDKIGWGPLVDATRYVWIAPVDEGAQNVGLAFATTTVAGEGIERGRFTHDGNLLVGKTSSSVSGTGVEIHGVGFARFVRDNQTIIDINRLSTDGTLVDFRQASTLEGTISVSGTTVSYNGGHLSRWSRLADDSKDTSIVKGTVMTNLDAMVEWGDEDNEQLNKMAVSSVEGDANVAGVFVNWDEDDDWNDMNIAMTGDMVIRIAQGTTVARGDLLMSAGDGTAKPQGDDIVRSKTIAKVTSTHVSHTYDDGSYLVPCVLMAC